MSERNTPTFEECVIEAFANKELLSEYDRLNKTNLMKKGSPIDLMIDGACDRYDQDIKGFFSFVKTAVFEPLIGRKSTPIDLFDNKVIK